MSAQREIGRWEDDGRSMGHGLTKAVEVLGGGVAAGDLEQELRGLRGAHQSWKHGGRSHAGGDAELPEKVEAELGVLGGDPDVRAAHGDARAAPDAVAVDRGDHGDLRIRQRDGGLVAR